MRKIEASQYIDRIVHTWYVNSFLKEYFISSFITTSYACIEGRGMHKAALAEKKAMLECKKKYGIYYIIKMDVAKYFQNISECRFKILLLNNTTIIAKAYDGKADYLYQNAKIGDMINIVGILNDEMKVEIYQIG